MTEFIRTDLPIHVVIYCSICSKEPPYGGCDATGCTWRTEAVANAIRDGALFYVVCDESNNSEQDISAGKLTATVNVYRTTKGIA